MAERDTYPYGAIVAAGRYRREAAIRAAAEAETARQCEAMRRMHERMREGYRTGEGETARLREQAARADSAF